MKRKEKTKKYLIAQSIIESILCLVSANATFIGDASPLFLAFLASSGNLFILGYISVMVLFFITDALSGNIFYIAGATIICGCKILFMLDKKKASKEALSILTLISMLLSLFIVGIFYKLSASEIIFRLFSSLICSGIVYLIELVKNKIESRSFFSHRKTHIISLAVLYVVILSSLSSLSIWGVNIGRIIGVCVVLCAAGKYKHTGGAVVGALSTCGIFLCNPQLSANTMLMATSGLICGLVSSMGVLVSVLVFMIVTILSLAVGHINSDSFNMLKDCAIGCVLYSCITQKAINRTVNFLGLKVKSVESVGETTSSGLIFVSSALSEIKNQINEISDTIKKKTKQMTSQRENRYTYSENIRTEMLRESLTEQLSTMENILNDMSARIIGMSRVDTEFSEKLRDELRNNGINDYGSCVYYDESENLTAEIYLPSDKKTDLVGLTLIVSEILSTEMDIPSVITNDKITKLTFSPKPEYELRVGIWQSSANDIKSCGDTIGIVPVSAREEYVVLSDGMGTGKRAKLDSMFASSLVSKLVKAGISCATSVRIINSVLRTKGWEESFATLDIAKFDLYKGVCNFIKAGAASSFILRDGVVNEIVVESMPLGIINEIHFEDRQYKLFDGDVIILASDGIGEYAKKIISESSSENIRSSDKFARSLGSKFFEIIPENRRDDMSIIVIKVLCTSI